jgi:phenylpropionate dioxygenase-like ring-hydroxylating dioxygenase large terminal subunit
MIREQWYVVLESREVRKRPVGFLRMGERLVFWRDAAGKVVCHYDKCAHRGASLAIGKLVDGCRIQCPFHGLEYDATGKCTLIPANGRAAPVPEAFRLRTYPTHEAHGFIWIWWGETEPASEPKFFDDMPEGEFEYATTQDPWKNHYSRSIENQLDMAHLPFIHYNTIGRGNRTVVDGPGLMRAEEGFFVYVYNRPDDGSPRRTSEEVPVPDPDSDFRLEFRFPNLWENRVGEKVRIVAAFVPIDDATTILYLRFCQSFMRLPILKGLVGFFGKRTNLVIAHQDRRVVETQIPVADGTGAGENLFPGDLPIMEYRKMRLEAKKKLEGRR